MTRSRTCSNPTPTDSQHYCHGDPVQSVHCNDYSCPGTVVVHDSNLYQITNSECCDNYVHVCNRLLDQCE